MRFQLSLAFTLVLAACASAHATPPSEPAPAKPEGRLIAPDPGADLPVWTYVSTPWGFETNTFFVEGPSGLVAVDTQFLPSAIAEAVDRVEAATAKRVVLAVVLHPNPDKFNGTATLQARGVRVVTSAQVAERIPAVHALRKSWFYERYRPDYPAEAATPEVFGDATTTLSAAGLSLKLHVMGPGVSAAQVVVEIGGHVFAGDLLTNGHHSWLELGLLDAWRARLGEIAALGPRIVHPGRGESGGPELIDAERAYLDFVEARVAAAQPHGEPTKAQLMAIRAELEARYPSYDYRVFLRVGLPAVWRTVAARD
ncbi:MAG: hydrolase [Deltaproteobacteria bacterium]|nr:MAG: hydrolase [Deltaproteobacteria bacterium]